MTADSLKGVFINMARYPNTIGGLLGLLVFAVVAVVLLAPTLNADPAQVVIIVGVLVLGIQQLLAAKLAEGNGHRLNQVERDATEAAKTSAVNAERVTAIEQTPTVNAQLPDVPLVEPVPEAVPEGGLG